MNPRNKVSKGKSSDARYLSSYTDDVRSDHAFWGAVVARTRGTCGVGMINTWKLYVHVLSPAESLPIAFKRSSAAG
jgi:hypothetical protein